MTIGEEVLYSFRVNHLNSLQITKWVDGKRYPAETYTVTQRGKGKCDCMGSWRQPYCKHRQMVDFILQHFPTTRFAGAFYDADKQLLYHPDDGEGIALSGAVDIVGLLG